MVPGRNLKTSTENRKPYGGPVRSLVIAIDIGTTFSGVSYAILEPGEIPKIHGVTRFPGQEHVAGNSKIPSVIYYDKHGKMMAAGAEADTAAVISQAEDFGWIKTELFKLRLRPRTMKLNMNGMRLGPLPKRQTAVHVFGDFLAYLYKCTRVFITDTHGNGAALWNAVEHDIQFVLSHPNGWEGAQQTKMRRAAVYGNLIPDTNEGKARIRFVTEGEASLHACVLNGLAADVLSNPSKHGFLIADAGGGTLDISAYAIRGTAPLVMEEIAPPDCIFAGSVFVSRRAREFLEEKLKNSKYGTPDALDHITQRFDETTKRLFRDRKDLQFIPFGSPLDKDPSVGIRGGQLKLTGDEVADLFEPSIQAAFSAIKAQIDASKGVIRSVFLVGGYAASPWLFSQLQERLAPFRITVSRPDAQTSKAVADGAIGFYCDHHVSARVAKFMYGVEFLRELDPSDPDHVARKGRLCELPSGPKLLPDAFDCVLSRGVKVKESTVFTRKYCTELTSLSMLSVFEVEIWCYRGGNVIPKWIIRDADDFSTLCVVRADLSPLSGSAEAKIGRNGKTYWTIVFSIEIHFGLTEFKARIKWVDDGKTKYGPASIIYNDRGHRADEEEPDVFPEDDAGPLPEPRNRLRSEPVSRALTPTDQYFTSGNAERSQRASIVEPPKVEPAPTLVPEVARVRTPSPSRSLAPPTPFPADLTRDMPQSLSIEQESDPKGKGKEKTPMATPKGTPKIGDTLSAVWGANPSTNPSSPIPPSPLSLALEGPKTPKFASVAHTPKGKDKKSLDVSSSKTSPSIPANRSPLGTTTPIVEQVTEPTTAASAEPPVEISIEPPAEQPAEAPADQQQDPSTAAPADQPEEPSTAAPAAPPAEALAPAAEPAEPPPASAVASPQVLSPLTGKKKKKGAAKGSSPALDTKTEPSSSLPSAAATPQVVSEAALVDDSPTPLDTGSMTSAEPEKPADAAEPTEPPAQPETPVASTVPAASPQVLSPITGKKKKKGAAKGSSPALDTKIEPSSSLPSVAATPQVVSAAALVDIDSPTPVDTGSVPPAEPDKPADAEAPPAAEPTESPAQPPETPAASTVPAASPQVLSPVTGKKKKGAAKGSSPALDTKTEPSSSLPSVAATPQVVSAAALVDIGPASVDTSSTPLAEPEKPDPVSETTDTSSLAVPPAPETKSLSNVLSPVELPDTTVDVATVPAIADTNLAVDASAADPLPPPKDSSLFGSSPWDNAVDGANAETSSGFEWGTVPKTPKTSKTPKVGTSPSTPWGKSPAKASRFSFGGIGSGSTSPKPPSATPARSPWASLGPSTPESTLDTKPTQFAELDVLGEPSKPDDSSEPATQEHANNIAPAASGPAGTESGSLPEGSSPNPPTTALSGAHETQNPMSSPQPSRRPTPKPAESDLPPNALEITSAAVPESTTEHETTAHPAPTGKNPSPTVEVSVIEDTSKLNGESIDEVKPDDPTAVELSSGGITEPQTPADIGSPAMENYDGAADDGGGEGGGDEEKDEAGETRGSKGRNESAKKKAKKGKKGKKG